VQSYGWNVPFEVASALCLTAAALFGGIDATRKIFVDEMHAV